MSNKLHNNLSIAGILLKEAVNQKITIENFAKAVGTTRSTLYNWKRKSSKMPVAGLIQMCKILHTPVTYFPENDTWEIGGMTIKGTRDEDLWARVEELTTKLTDQTTKVWRLEKQLANIGRDPKGGK